MRGIFISYRRDDSIGHAGRLSDCLVAHFGSGRVFQDVDSIDPGEDFIEKIEAAVAACDVLVVVIGRQWLTIQDEAGSRRLDDPDDLVRREVEVALDRHVRIIPTLVAGARMPQPKELPASLGALARRNALVISDTDFIYSAKRLVGAIERAISDADGQRRSPYSGVTRTEGTAPSPKVATTRSDEESPFLKCSEGDDVRIQSGTVIADATFDGWSLLAGDGERVFTKQISFSEPVFLTPPTIAVALVHLDAATHVYTRISISAQDVSKNGFLLVLKTWSDSQVYGVGASWVAYGS